MAFDTDGKISELGRAYGRNLTVGVGDHDPATLCLGGFRCAHEEVVAGYNDNPLPARMMLVAPIRLELG